MMPPSFQRFSSDCGPSAVPREHEREPPDCRSLWQTRTLIFFLFFFLTPLSLLLSLHINLLYSGLNMSRVDVTLRLCRGQTEEGGVEWRLLRLSALVSTPHGRQA